MTDGSMITGNNAPDQRQPGYRVMKPTEDLEWHTYHLVENIRPELKDRLKTPPQFTEKRKYGDEEIEVAFIEPTRRDADELTESEYPPVEPSVTVSNGIIYERDVPVALRDGTIINVDVYRPDCANTVPAIVAQGPQSKRGGYAPTPMNMNRGVPPGAISRMARSEGPDPGYWVHQGYAVINPEMMGTGNAQGNKVHWGTQEGRNGYDIVEWVGTREWCTGRVTMYGNSWLSMCQWFAAAEKPPHLTCITPNEGTSDIYREFLCWGGIPELGFNDRIIRRIAGLNLSEDYLGMLYKYPLMNAYWEDKIPRFEDIEIPAYVTTGWSHFHNRGSWEGFRKISSPKKWMRAHRDMEWPDAHNPEVLEDLKRYWDRYLKDIYNGWEETPRVRLDVMDAGDIDFQHNRPEKEFPLARTQYTRLFLDARTGSLSASPLAEESAVRYDATPGKDGTARFTIKFNRDTEITGYLKLRLWVEADGANDMDLFVYVRKLDEEGQWLPTLILDEPWPGIIGKMRVSRRELDEETSTPFQPRYTYRKEEFLKPGEIVPVEIEIWPSSMIWHAGQQLSVVVAGHYIRRPGWFEPFAWDLRNKGNHIIHTGGRYDSHLLIPVVPPKYQAGNYVYR